MGVNAVGKGKQKTFNKGAGKVKKVVGKK